MSLADEENVQPLLSEQSVETGEPVLPAPEPQVVPPEPEPEPEPEPDEPPEDDEEA